MQPTDQGLDIARYGVATACMKFLLKYCLKIARKKPVKTLGFSFQIEIALYSLSSSVSAFLFLLEPVASFLPRNVLLFSPPFEISVEVNKGSGYS